MSIEYIRDPFVIFPIDNAKGANLVTTSDDRDHNRRQFFVEWHDDEFKYHVWLGFGGIDGVIYKNSIHDKRANTRYLNLYAKKWTELREFLKDIVEKRTSLEIDERRYRAAKEEKIKQAKAAQAEAEIERLYELAEKHGFTVTPK